MADFLRKKFNKLTNRTEKLKTNSVAEAPIEPLLSTDKINQNLRYHRSVPNLSTDNIRYDGDEIPSSHTYPYQSGGMSCRTCRSCDCQSYQVNRSSSSSSVKIVRTTSPPDNAIKRCNASPFAAE